MFDSQVNSTGYKRVNTSGETFFSFDSQVNSTGYKSYTVAGLATLWFDRQVNSTGYKRSNRIKKKIFESHVGSAWRTGRGRKADNNFFFDKFYMKLQHVCSACTVKLRFESSVIL